MTAAGGHAKRNTRSTSKPLLTFPSQIPNKVVDIGQAQEDAGLQCANRRRNNRRGRGAGGKAGAQTTQIPPLSETPIAPLLQVTPAGSLCNKLPLPEAHHQLGP